MTRSFSTREVACSLCVLKMSAPSEHVLHAGDAPAKQVDATAGEDLPLHTYFLDHEATGPNGWPTIVIPSVADPGLAPPGQHVLHATMAAPLAEWRSVVRGTDAYQALKTQKGAMLHDLVRKVCSHCTNALLSCC